MGLAEQHRQNAETESRTDLEKPVTQLLADIHDELLRTDWPPEVRMIHAQKRLASLHVKVAMAEQAAAEQGLALQAKMETASTENGQLQVKVAEMTERMEKMTWVMMALTVVTVVLGGLQLLAAVIDLCRS